jgi:hypothetical protein
MIIGIYILKIRFFFNFCDIFIKTTIITIHYKRKNVIKLIKLNMNIINRDKNRYFK